MALAGTPISSRIHAVFSMPILISLTLGFIVAVLAMLVAVFSAEVIAGLWSRPRDSRPEAPRDHRADARIAVLVPAHDEGTGLVPTLADVRQQLHTSDRLLVVADNCSDDTAAVAAKNGAEVIERHDLARRGKGYALDFGIKHLSSAPPDILIMVDADCRIAHGTISA